jgi:hypothetical protein
MHSKLLTIARVFNIKLKYRLSEVGYDSIIECEKNILPEGNRLKRSFYIAKSMMKPISLGYKKINVSKLLHVIQR